MVRFTDTFPSHFFNEMFHNRKREFGFIDEERIPYSDVELLMEKYAKAPFEPSEPFTDSKDAVSSSRQGNPPIFSWWEELALLYLFLIYYFFYSIFNTFPTKYYLYINTFTKGKQFYGNKNL